MNYRSVYKVIDRIEINRAYTQGDTHIKLSEKEYIHGVYFIGYVATDVYVSDHTLEILKREPFIKEVGLVKELRYSSLNKYERAL